MGDVYCDEPDPVGDPDDAPLGDPQALIDAWPEVAAFFHTEWTPWRDEVESWRTPWKKWFHERTNAFIADGMCVVEAERVAYDEIVNRRMANLRETSQVLIGGARPIPDPIVRPPMARRKPRKAVRMAMPTMFDGMDDGTGTTYMEK